MRTKRRARPVPTLEEMTTEDLFIVEYFGALPNGAYVVPRDKQRAFNLLCERGAYRPGLSRDDRPA